MKFSCLFVTLLAHSLLPASFGLPILSSRDRMSILPRDDKRSKNTILCGTGQDSDSIGLQLRLETAPCYDTLMIRKLTGFVRPAEKTSVDGVGNQKLEGFFKSSQTKNPKEVRPGMESSKKEAALAPVINHWPYSKSHRKVQCEHTVDLFIIAKVLNKSNFCNVRHKLRKFLQQENVDPEVVEAVLPPLGKIQELANSEGALSWLDEETHLLKSNLMRFMFTDHQVRGKPENWPPREDARMALLVRYMQIVHNKGRLLSDQIDEAVADALTSSRLELAKRFTGTQATFPKGFGPRILAEYDQAVSLVTNLQALGTAWGEQLAGKKWEATKKLLSIPEPARSNPLQKGLGDFLKPKAASSSGTQPAQPIAKDVPTGNQPAQQTVKTSTSGGQPAQRKEKTTTGDAQLVQPNAKASTSSAQPIQPNAKTITGGQPVQPNTKASTSGTQPVRPNTDATTSGVQPVQPNTNAPPSAAQPVAQSSTEGAKKSAALPGSSKDVQAEAQQVADSKRKRIYSPPSTDKPDTNKAKKA